MNLVIINKKKRSMKRLVLFFILCVIGVVAGIHFLLSGSSFTQSQRIEVNSVTNFSFDGRNNTASFECITRIKYDSEKEENYQYSNSNLDDAQRIRENCIPM